MAYCQIMKDYVEVAESAEAQGDSGWYAYLRTLNSKQRMSFSDLARECIILFVLADRIQQSTVKSDDTKVWQGLKEAMKQIDEKLIDKLNILWAQGEEVDDGILARLYGE